MTSEQQARYKAELLKVGFDGAAAQRIVDEAADRIRFEDKFGRPTSPFRSDRQPKIETQKEDRAADVVYARHTAEIGRPHIAWTPLRPQKPTGRPRRSKKSFKGRGTPKPGQNALQAMQEALARDLKTLEFTPDEIAYITEA